MISDIQRECLRKAFREGQLRTRSVSPSGVVEWRRVLKVHRADVRPESVWELRTEHGSMVATGGHRVYKSPDPAEAVDAEALKVGDRVVGVVGGALTYLRLIDVRQLPDRQWMYDLTVEGNHNTVTVTSRICSHNSPDRNYHFRPPAHETTVQQFNQVFGYIWEDEELQEYLARGIDMIAAAPPRTPFTNCDQLVQCYPEWRTLLLNGAMMHALLALMINWIADEFSYSIGGVSLDIEKSSKYESAYQALNDQFDKQLERAKQTVRVIRGLQQPRFGVGIRSAFGPHVGSGVLTPRKFVGF